VRCTDPDFLSLDVVAVTLRDEVDIVQNWKGGNLLIVELEFLLQFLEHFGETLLVDGWRVHGVDIVERVELR
jgi:hypothetical protein